MKKVYCDLCGNEIPYYPTAHGSWYKGITWTVKITANVAGAINETHDVCGLCIGTLKKIFGDKTI